MASLHPVAGPPRELLGVLRVWLEEERPEPLIVRTSGSMDEPKNVLLSRAAMTASAQATLRRLGGPGQWLLSLPARYVAGLQVLMRSLLGGVDPVLRSEHDSFTAAVAAMAGNRRYAALVPTQLTRLLETDPGTLRSFDAVLIGGAAADRALLDRAYDAGVRIVTTYGMTETCGGCVYDGRPLDDVGVRLGADGRIHLSGPVLFDGYQDAPGLTARTLVDGELRTQDLGRYDDDGRLRVLGRVDDVVISGGVNVALPAVRDRICEHSAIQDAAVVGVDDAEWGARVVAYVVADPVPALEELRDFVSERLPRSWAPREQIAVPQIPLLYNGKVDRQALRSAQ